MKTQAIKIGSLTFAQYIGKRLEKDGIGFLPVDNYFGACTDRMSFIKAMIPKTEYDFLVYAHELGHCRGKQLPNVYYNSFFGVTKDVVYNEFLATDWAFRYVKRLGMKFEKSVLEKFLKDSICSYLSRVRSDFKCINDLVDKYSEKWGLSIEHVVGRTPKSWFDASYDIFPKGGKTITLLWDEMEDKFKDVKYDTIYDVPEVVTSRNLKEVLKAKKAKPHKDIVEKMNKSFKRKGWK